MSRFVIASSAAIVAAVLVSGTAFMPTAAAAAAAATMSDADKAALKQARAACKAQVKEQAQFHEMSWYARHKAVNNCVKDALANHPSAPAPAPAPVPAAAAPANTPAPGH